MGNNQCLVEMKGIVKRFPGVVALDKVDFDIRKGEVHVLLGENGAGKSTLVKVLSGAYIADAGEIYIEGQKVAVTSPEIALQKGLRFIYQEPTLVPDLDVAKNIFLGMEPSRWGFVNVSLLYQRSLDLLREIGVDLDPSITVRSLSVAEQKIVEIVRALVTSAKVIVLDEPTDVLESRAREKLFALIRRLKAQGVSFVYISHRYAEVYEIGDRVTILRDGKKVGTFHIFGFVWHNAPVLLICEWIPHLFMLYQRVMELNTYLVRSSKLFQRWFVILQKRKAEALVARLSLQSSFLDLVCFVR